MHCPKCGAEVAELSVYCHKCGERIDLDEEQSSPSGQGEAEAGQYAPPEVESRQPTDEPAPAPAERFRETATARQAADEEPEEDLWQGRYSSKAMIRAWALSGLITVALLVLGIWIWRRYAFWPMAVILVALLLLWLYQFFAMKYRQWHVRYRLTNQRFIHETGILRRVTDRIEVIDMDDITFEQTLLERFVGVGTIRISSSDRTHPELLLEGIDNVKEVAGTIDDTRRSERRRRGLHIESI